MKRQQLRLRFLFLSVGPTPIAFCLGCGRMFALRNGYLVDPVRRDGSSLSTGNALIRLEATAINRWLRTGGHAPWGTFVRRAWR